MENFTIGSSAPNPGIKGQHIYCPSLQGLSARLADATFLMPRIDQNQRVKETKGHGQWAAAIAADPFGSNSTHFRALIEAGYSGVVNWPSSILLEGQMQQAISTIPASPKAEYSYLAKAQAAGFDTLAFFLTPDQATEALAAGLKNLVLHPGILLDIDEAAGAMIRGALASMIASLKQTEPDVKVLVYTSNWHDSTTGLSQIACDGFVRFIEAQE